MSLRGPKPPLFLCPNCGATYRSPFNVHPVDMSDSDVEIINERLLVSCPQCQSTPVIVQEAARRSPTIEIVTAIRAADLSATQVEELREALLHATPGTTPRDLGEQVPFATNIIVVASRAGRDWIIVLLAILTLLAAVYFGALAHQDAQQAAAPPNKGTSVHRSSQLTDEDLKKIAAQVEADLRAADRSSKQPPESQSGGERPDQTTGTNKP